MYISERHSSGRQAHYTCISILMYMLSLPLHLTKQKNIIDVYKICSELVKRNRHKNRQAVVLLSPPPPPPPYLHWKMSHSFVRESYCGVCPPALQKNDTRLPALLKSTLQGHSVEFVFRFYHAGQTPLYIYIYRHMASWVSIAQACQGRSQ